MFSIKYKNFIFFCPIPTISTSATTNNQILGNKTNFEIAQPLILLSLFNDLLFQLDDSVFTETPDDNIEIIGTDSTFYKDLIRVIAIDVVIIVVFGLLFDLIFYCKKSKSTNGNVAAKGYATGMIVL